MAQSVRCEDFHPLEAAPIAENRDGERFVLHRIGGRDQARVFDPGGLIDMLDDPLGQRLPEDSRLEVAIPRAASDWLIGFHGSELSSSRRRARTL
jgi:hypothetical protein